MCVLYCSLKIQTVHIVLLMASVDDWNDGPLYKGVTSKWIFLTEIFLKNRKENYKLYELAWFKTMKFIISVINLWTELCQSKMASGIYILPLKPSPEGNIRDFCLRKDSPTSHKKTFLEKSQNIHFYLLDSLFYESILDSLNLNMSHVLIIESYIYVILT